MDSNSYDPMVDFDEEQGLAPRTRLDGLQTLQDQFQVDAFIKAAQKGGKGLTSLLKGSLKKSPAKSPESIGLEDLLVFSNEPMPTSLLKLNMDHMGRAVKMFNSILKYMGESGEPMDTAAGIEIAQKLLHQGLKRPELKDELYMQLVKQTRGNPNVPSRLKAWELFLLVTATMPPNKDFVGLVSEYIHAVANNEAEAPQVKAMASKAWSALKRSAKSGPRRTLPSTEEIEFLFQDRQLTSIVFFLDETFEELFYDATSTVLEAVEQLAGMIRLHNYSTFTLFECRRPLGKNAQGDYGVGDQPVEEHLLLDDNKYIADVLCEFRNSKAAKEGWQSRLLFKKRMFRETDEAITEAQFINLSYVQAQYDYLQGNYPVVREDASQMCALQMQAEHGSSLLDVEEDLLDAIERYITKQVLTTRPREEWFMDVTARYRALEQFSKEDARLQFLRILRSLPYGNSIFFPVKRIEDPIGLLPAKLILGINKRGVHFFRPVPKEYLHSAELRDIMQFGSSSTAVFFKMRVAGVLHIFQFETRQGEDICMALQTHINDIMMKRYSKAKALSAEGRGQQGRDLAMANFGPKYEQHVAQLQKSLDETNHKLEDMQRDVSETRLQRDGLQAELTDLMDQLQKEVESKVSLQDAVDKLTRELETMRSDLLVARAAAEQGKTLEGQEGKSGVSQLEAAVEDRTRELAEATEKAASLEKRVSQLTKEKELIEKKMQRIERAKDQETSELRIRLNSSQGDVRSQLKEKDQKINEILEELASVNALYNETRDHINQFKVDAHELEELRELRADIERKDKQQATIIANQTRRLEELERLYKDEQVSRKRAVNMMEEMKGQIRVYCRIRPVLPSEEGKAIALSVPDELSIAHATSDGGEKEYSFDGVFEASRSQVDVFEDTRHLVQSALDGYNACVFAFGETGSGKSHTLFGVEHEHGLVPRSVHDMFRTMGRDASKYTFTVTVEMLEVYQDEVTDVLLGQGRAAQPLVVKKDFRGVVQVAGATRLTASNSKQLMEVIRGGLARRDAACAAAKRAPSSSHLLLSMGLEAVNLQTHSVTRGKLRFVELAGSERVSRASGGEDMRKSLCALRDVVGALGAEQPMVPYRGHKLPMLLSDALGGNCKSLLIVHVAPTEDHMADTYTALTFGLGVRAVKNEASKNESNKDMQKMRRQVEYWKEQSGLSPEQIRASELMSIEDRVQVEAEIEGYQQ